MAGYGLPMRYVFGGSWYAKSLEFLQMHEDPGEASAEGYAIIRVAAPLTTKAGRVNSEVSRRIGGVVWG